MSGEGQDPNVKLGVIEEQVRGMRHDFNKLEQEVKSMFGQVLQHMSNMQKDYVPKQEFEREVELLREENKEVKGAMKDLTVKVEKLHGRPTLTTVGVFTGAVAVIAVLATIIAAYIQTAH